MSFGRSRRAVKYDEFINRIRKSFYFGGTAVGDDINLISLPLASYASELFSKSHRNYSLNRLSTFNACKIQASPCSLIMAFIFLERLNATDPSYVRRITPHELFIVSMMISTKFYVGHDEEIYLSDWATEGNMTEDRLKRLELEFLCAIDWNIYISNEEFFKKLDSVEKSLAQREGFRRGWLTYTELLQVMPSLKMTKFLVNAFLNHIAVMIVTYAAGVLTIVGAFFLASQIPGHMLHRSSRTGTESSLPTDSTTRNLSDPLQMAVNNGKLSVTESTENGTSLESVIARHNATCNALNVEAELLRLDHQYKEEQEAEKLLKRNNEANYISYPKLTIGSKQQSRGPYKFTKLEHKWLGIKDTYSDPNRCSLKENDSRTKCPPDYVNKGSIYLYKCLKNFGNCTSSLFWQLLSETAQESFVRLPLVWFKFI